MRFPTDASARFGASANSIHTSAWVVRHLPDMTWINIFHRTAFYAREECNCSSKFKFKFKFKFKVRSGVIAASN